MITKGNRAYATLLFAIVLAAASAFIPSIPPLARIIVTALFLLFVPGTVLLALLGIRALKGIERFVYTSALSVTFMVFSSLLANTLLPLVGIAEPMRALPLIVWTCALLTALLAIVYIRDKEEFSVSVAFPKLDVFNQNLLAAAFAILGLAVVGTALVNQGLTNSVSVAFVLLAGFYVVFVTVMRKRVQPAVYPVALICLALASLLIGWLRSNYVSGVDIDVEFFLFSNVMQNGIWSIGLFRDSYNACLSITLLPATIALFTGLREELVFKIAMPFLFSLSIASVYVFLTRYVREETAFLGAFFVVAQQAFLLWWSVPVKQQVGLFLFSAVIVALTSRSLARRTQLLLLGTLSLTLVVSHYTSTYITIAVFAMTSIASWAYLQFAKHPRASSALKLLRIDRKPLRKTTQQRAIPFVFVLFLILATYAWYFEITDTEGSSVNSFRQITSNAGNLFDEGARQAGILSAVFSPVYVEPEPRQLLLSFSEEVTLNAIENPPPNQYRPETYKDFSLRVVPDAVLPAVVPAPVIAGAYMVNELAKAGAKVLLVLGTGVLIFLAFRRHEVELEIMIITLCCFGILAAILFLPFASIAYSVSRAYQQITIVLALPLAFAIDYLGRVLQRMHRLVTTTLVISMCAFVLVIPFLFYLGGVPHIIGGGDVSALMNNDGRIYDEVYTHRGDVLAAEWFFTYTERDTIYATARAREKLWLSPDHDIRRVTVGVIPQLMDEYGYVYSDYTNTKKNKGFVATAGTTVTYRYPTAFLLQEKNIVYTNGDARIYK